jgi:glycerol-3-phosphate dehydrogenase
MPFNMNITIEGNGSFGSFLKELLAPHFSIVGDADTVILAVPLSAYDEVGKRMQCPEAVNRHLPQVFRPSDEPSSSIW